MRARTALSAPVASPAEDAAPPVSWGPGTSSACRVEDFLLGGGHNFAVDRDVARQLVTVQPEAPAYARAGRAFLGRAVRFVGAAGVDQFLVLGPALPLVGSVHEVAAGRRVVYVAADPLAVAFTRLAVADIDGVDVVVARPDQPVVAAGEAVRAGLLDLDRPVALVMAGPPAAIVDAPRQHRTVVRLHEMVARGSCLILSHSVASPDRTDASRVSAIYRRAGIATTPRSRATIAAMFAAFELLPPGLVPVDRWRPDDTDEPGTPVPRLGGVAVKT